MKLRRLKQPRDTTNIFDSSKQKIGSVFSHIYSNNVWGDGSILKPLSGPGSLPDNAKPYVDFIADAINRFSLATVLDVGHGDWNMWRDYRFENINYLGVDVADRVSINNMEKFGSKNIKFRQVDKFDPLPSADLLLCKDVLQHLSYEDIHIILSQISKFKFLGICNDIHLYVPLLRNIRVSVQLRTRLRKLYKFESPFYYIPFLRNNISIQSGLLRGLNLEDEIFVSYFKDFRLINRLDFPSEHPKGTVKRLLFFEKCPSR